MERPYNVTSCAVSSVFGTQNDKFQTGKFRDRILGHSPGTQSSVHARFCGSTHAHDGRSREYICEHQPALCLFGVLLFSQGVAFVGLGEPFAFLFPLPLE